MTSEERQALREAASRAMRSRQDPRPMSPDGATGKLVRALCAKNGWSLQTSNSFRRIGLHGDGDVLCATTHPVDGHPDLLTSPGVLEYIVAAQPRVVLELLDYIDELERVAAVDCLEIQRRSR